MTKTLPVIATITFIVFITVSCSKDKDNNGGSSLDCSTVAKSFATDVNPVIQASCNVAGCHATGSGNGPGALTNYTQVFNARTAIRSSVSSGRMPQGSSLSTAQKNSILCWIDSGAPNN
ncbi:MAG TPA: hypothetical protein VFV31_01425 [Chitinophagaceae bacterium]|nr:hypothetical protein [Chitinophagaceae bacterium]